MNPVSGAILASLLAVRAFETAAALLNLGNLRPEIPPEMEGVYDRQAYRRSQEYARATARAGLVRQWVDLAALCAFWFAGGFRALDDLARAWGGGPVLSGLLFVGALLLLSALLSLPFSVHATFVLEERFGWAAIKDVWANYQANGRNGKKAVNTVTTTRQSMSCPALAG